MQHETEHIKDLLGITLSQNQVLKKKMHLLHSKNVVEEVLGSQIMPYVEKIDIHEETIFIYTPQSVLRQEIRSTEAVLLERINTLCKDFQFKRISV